jgi:thiosulfate/3-mercaptopyruvate sulfurtransferase
MKGGRFMRVKLNKLLLNLFMMSYFLIILCFVKGCVVVDPFAGLLVSGDDLEAALGTSEMVIIDARSAGYESGHIPGAISLKWGDYVNDAKNLKPLSELEAQLGAVGLSRDMVFVIYDDTTVSWGAAGRVFWMLEYLGCTKAHILNGGWDKWVADGRATETTVNTLFPSVFVAEVKEDILVDKNHIQSRMSDDDVIIIDSRTDEEFNGWALYGETRGGHIPGAVQIPYAWFFKEDKTILDYQDLKNMLESRGITTDKEITSYCTAGIRSGFVYFILRLLGYTKCSNYDGSMYEWSADSSLPMEKMEYYEKLVYPAWVDALIAGGNPGTPDTPPTYPGNGYVILDLTTWDYDSGHIPGAIKVDWKEFNKGGTENYPPSIPEDANLKDPEEMQALLEEIGIDHDTTVVIYCTWATLYGRVAWALMCAGVEDIRILNGGLTEWKAYGGAVETIF